MNGYPTIVATLDPRAKYAPRTDDGRVMKKFRVRAWVHEADYQVVKIDAEAIEDLTFGWGIDRTAAQRLREPRIERQKVNDEVWLPARVHLIGTGRAVMFRRFAIDSVTEWFDYKKFGVRTDEDVRASGVERRMKVGHCGKDVGMRPSSSSSPYRPSSLSLSPLSSAATIASTS